LGGKSGKMGSLSMGVYTGMGRRQNRWIPIQSHKQVLGTIHGGGRTSPLQSLLLAVF